MADTLATHQSRAAHAQVRQDWGIRESVGQQGWQGIMRQYLRQDRQEAAKLAAELATAAPSTPASIPKRTRSCTEGYP